MGGVGSLSIVAPDMGVVLLFIGALACTPLLVGILYAEWHMLLPMSTAPLLFWIVGLFLMQVRSDRTDAKLGGALAAVALIWLISALIGALPFSFGIGMPYSDAVFEAMSGWTGTGLSLLVSADTAPHVLLFWRSLMQWLGGIGIVAVTVGIASRSGVVSRGLYQSEGRTEALLPGVMATALQMWKIYIVITLFSIGLVLLSGVSLWDAVNIAMAGISTGGFSMHTEGILWYDNRLLELLIIPVMIAGALPFKLYYLTYRLKKPNFFADLQVRLLFLLIGIGTCITACDLVLFNHLPVLLALFQSSFMVVSAISCTGFQNAFPHAWSSVTVLFLTLFMFIGGASGSTAGGIKLSRVILGIEGIFWWFRRFFVSWRGFVPFRHEGLAVPRKTVELEISKNMLVIVLYFLVAIAATITMLHLEYIPGFDSSNVVFEVVSAMCNVGISTGYVTPSMCLPSKWLFIFVMWAGRLEILPVIVLFMGAMRR